MRHFSKKEALMTAIKCWGSRGLVGSDLTAQTGALVIDEGNYDYQPGDLVLNVRETSSKRLAEQDLLSFLAKSADKSLDLYRMLSGTDARLVYFSTLDFNCNLYCDLKRWLETLPGKFLEPDQYKVVRIPGVLGSRLRKGPVFDIMQANIFAETNISLNLIDTWEISRLVHHLSEHWSDEPKEINLTPSAPITLRDVWNVVHNACDCEMPEPLRLDQQEAFLQGDATPESSFVLDTSEFYLRRFLKDHGPICHKQES